MKKDDLIYLDHIVQSLKKVKEYVEGVEYEGFLHDEEKQDAIIRKIEAAGEADKTVEQRTASALPGNSLESYCRHEG